ncbi:pilus assembly FimT family protein [Acinetobacter soli]|uniref:pilus assembly FimT family protein n=1 Tax=Acinetobacter soli TaxID=487316 RepID=UPI00124EFED9|nr:prepilin-type N-terminal cleavage/methylation domain-containing protein [Acinetobacter soli]MBO3639094.1 prepilin-type N-terminal cleavage/methylation domain-containing protein [Acinetobacter soli]MEB4799412.1 prepilin-type N-terminal cleavage/methylation domain-containing protein [Acinetobacter soli]
MQKMKGFTLIELIITITVLAILATIAVPSFTKMIAQQRLNADYRDLINILTEARSQAILLRKEVIVKKGNGSNSSAEFYFAPKYTQIVNPIDTTLVKFNPYGTIEHDVTFKLCNNQAEKQKEITLMVTGILGQSSEQLKQGCSL